MIPKIAILGDFNPVHATHHALNDSIRDVKKLLNKEIQFDWIGTDIFNEIVFEKQNYTGLWIAPGSPYKDFENVLKVIEYTRKNNIPTFGNCGGFQHMIIEFARNECEITNADHEETNPDSENVLIKKLMCSLVGEQENLKLIDKESFLYKTMGVDEIVGKYYCSYGINEDYVETLKERGLSFTSKSEEGHYRSFEIKSHPFFVGTLFQPTLTSTTEAPNPVIVEFVKHCL
ncbi:glutamine amidotransferase-related protein [Chryseobacterium populi]|uniref:CTP synthase (glutamine hydrolyzing) n=1 Tax=Chryseobacterium populi TaxID=1144316 RepID=J2T3T3_9FLAO|nr:CTP synthase (UTP-ammonia lyase) [Chryseobacterium populi]EJL72677.1 CTP synthase (UTP-ammonia lyase) [Chryseobacterium populi]